MKLGNDSKHYKAFRGVAHIICARHFWLMDEKRSFVICCACGLLLLVVLWDDFDGMNLKLKREVFYTYI